MKRRLRESWRERLGRVPAGRDYVLIARPALGEALAGHDAGWLGERLDEVLGKAVGMRHLSLAPVRAFVPVAGVAGAPTLQVPPDLLRVRARSRYRELGLVRGTAKTAWRLLRCNPWSRGGVDYPGAPAVILAGILTPIENALAWLLEHLHDSVGLSWGWSIVALTIIVRICLVPLMVKQIHSMQRMQAHMPEMKALQQKYKGDRQRLNEELMKFYKENEINPAASCLPMLVADPGLLRAVLRARGTSRST